MSGRAGRRGFDPVGNVVFFGVPYRKVQRLITANVPKLVGNFPINVSLVLRMLLITSKGDDKKDALRKVCRKDAKSFLSFALTTLHDCGQFLSIISSLPTEGDMSCDAG